MDVALTVVMWVGFAIGALNLAAIGGLALLFLLNQGGPARDPAPARAASPPA